MPISPNNIPNQAPAPNRRLHFPFGSFGEFECVVCAPPACPAAVGEAQRWASSFVDGDLE